MIPVIIEQMELSQYHTENIWST